MSTIRGALHVEDVLFLSVDQASVVFHTHDRQFFLRSTLEDWKIILSDFNFEELDRGVLVHMSKVKAINSEYRIIYFDENLKGVTSTMSASKLKFAIQNYPHIQFIKK
mgnify:CR=1 FL=1|jgi:Response regulator of the LytR/AlgR family